MDETSRTRWAPMGFAVGGLTILGSMLVGFGSIVVAVVSMDNPKWQPTEATGLCLIAAAFAFGFAANAVWRK